MRRRMIKPEFFRSETMAKVSCEAALLAIGLLWQGGDVPPALKIGRRTYFERADVVRWLRERARPMGGAR